MYCGEIFIFELFFFSKGSLNLQQAPWPCLLFWPFLEVREVSVKGNFRFLLNLFTFGGFIFNFVYQWNKETSVTNDVLSSFHFWTLKKCKSLHSIFTSKLFLKQEKPCKYMTSPSKPSSKTIIERPSSECKVYFYVHDHFLSQVKVKHRVLACPLTWINQVDHESQVALPAR